MTHLQISPIERVAKALVGTALVDGRINLARIAREAGVSRSFLYQNEEAISLVAQARSRLSDHQHEREQQAEGTLRQRALNAESRVAELARENAILLNQVKTAVGLVERGKEIAIQENYQMKQTIAALRREKRNLRQEINSLVENLEASRDVVRALDSRCAQLEVQLLEREHRKQR